MSAALELREAELCQAECGQEKELDGLLDLVVGDAYSLGARRAAAVVDQDVDSAEGF